MASQQSAQAQVTPEGILVALSYERTQMTVLGLPSSTDDLLFIVCPGVPASAGVPDLRDSLWKLCIMSMHTLLLACFVCSRICEGKVLCTFRPLQSPVAADW